MRRALLALVPLLAPLLAPAALSAQTVTGVVVDSAGGRAAEGVLVVLLDGQGRQRARALSDASGRFAVQAPVAGSYRLRAERVGQRSVLSAPLPLGPGESRAVELRVGGAPLTLAGITLTAESRRCRVRPEEGLQTAVLWEEARKALNAADWSGGRRAFRFQATTYTRELQPGSLAVLREERRVATSTGRHPFVGLPAEELASGGYVRPGDGGTMYYAPDAGVLLSDVFLDGHCFRVQEPAAGEPGLVGLAFEPVRGRGRPDVQGVLWLDRGTAELRRLDFRYTGLELAVPAAGVGGRVEFERVATGAWFVRRWWIRMPALRVEQENRRSTEGTGIEQRQRETLLGLREEGGEVTAVLHGDGTPLVAAAGATLAGVVFDSTRAAPLAGATVYLSGTGFSARSDEAGRFRIEGLPAGAYSVAFHHPRLDTLATSVPPRQLSLAGGGVDSLALVIPASRGPRLADSRPQAPAADGAVPLAEMRVTGQPRSPWLAAARRREVAGSGYFIPREAIARQRSTQTAELFRAVPGFEVIGTRVRLRGSGGPLLPRADLAATPGSGASAPGSGGGTGGAGEGAGTEPGTPDPSADCVPAIYLDGSRFETMTGDLATLAPGDLELIEVYPRASLAPPQFRQPGADCGVILIWLKEKR